MKLVSLNLPKTIITANFYDELSKIIKNKKCIIFTSKFWSDNKLLKHFKKNKTLEIIDDIEPNPKLDNVFKININLKEANYVICLGGGSVIDFAKAVIAFHGCDRNRKFFQETITFNKKFNLKMIPEIIAIPTTSGTGSELNSWGTIWQKNKYSVSGDKLLPSIIILDSSLCITMPVSLTISSA